MIERKPQLYDCEGIDHTSLCQYCGFKLVDSTDEVYTALKGWMCERCFLGQDKGHCKPCPYQRPR